MMPAPRPIGLIAISTVTATISAMPAARRNATKIRGSAAGMMILQTRSRRRQPQRARHFHQPRFDAARPRRGSGSGSARRRQRRRSRFPCDSRSRARSARSATARSTGSAGSPRRSLPSAGRSVSEIPKAMPSASPMTPPIASPANAANSVSRVAVRIEPSAKAPTSAATMALGGARRIALQMRQRAPRSSKASSAATGSTSALARSGITASVALMKSNNCAAQPQEFRMLAGRQLIARPRQIDLAVRCRSGRDAATGR